jgi:hypothetical protein
MVVLHLEPDWAVRISDIKPAIRPVSRASVKTRGPLGDVPRGIIFSIRPPQFFITSISRKYNLLLITFIYVERDARGGRDPVIRVSE